MAKAFGRPGGGPPGYRFFKDFRKPTRMLSGVTVVALAAHPHPCPHGRCAYCPGGVEMGTPQSYVRSSPAIARALSTGFSPYEQVRLRLRQYVAMGHKPSKVELIVLGGTFPSFPLDYQEWFIAQAVEALNRFPDARPGGWVSLEEALARNERAKIRCVGITLETRPDWSGERHVDRFLRLAATRVELGVQSVYDDVLSGVDRGHGVRDVVEATRVLKDSGYKVTYHLMLGLPGSDPDRDAEMFQTIYEDEKFRPDSVKIYPTVVVPGTRLYRDYVSGRYRPYDLETLLELIAKVKAMTPPWVRIIRVQRDIPLPEVAAGPPVGNLRELVWSYMRERGLKCRCIRCREVGRYVLWSGEEADASGASLTRVTYEASGGTEVFLSVEDCARGILYGFLRLRIPSAMAHRWEIDRQTAIVRELHTYGPQTPVGERGAWWQHRGIGSSLMREAERVAAEEFNCRKILVISGVGVREYYRRLGYRQHPDSFYMYKIL